jgi:hypothetical protein
MPNDNQEGTGIEKKKTNPFALLTIISALSVVTVILFLAIVNLTLLANEPWVIPLRNFYAQVARQVTSREVYTIQPQKSLESGLYTYILVGKFTNFSAEDNTIAVEATDGKTYIFRADSALRQDEDIWLVIYYVKNLRELATTSRLSSYRQTLINNGVPAVAPTEVLVRWNDNKPLTQIKTSYQENPKIPLNLTFPESIILGEFGVLNIPSR